MSARKFILTAVLVAGGFMATRVMALTVKLEQGSFSYNIGGEFVAAGEVFNQYGQYYVDGVTTYRGNNLDKGFGTFCMEYNEHYSPGATYDVTLSDSAIYGGVGSQGDPISVGTAYLYAMFATKQLAGYDYYNTQNSRKTDAGALQDAIWYLEGERTLAQVSNSKFINLVLDINHFGSLNAATNDNNGRYSVKVMNLWGQGHAYDNNYRCQDQLVYVPDGGMTMALLGFGLASLSALRCRFRKA